MKYFMLVVLFCYTFIITSVPTQAAYFASSDTTAISTPIADDTFISGNSIVVTAPVSGELFAAGNSVTVNQKSARSLFAAGNTVSINQGAGYNAFTAGNTVTLAGEFGHDVYAAGSNVVITEGTKINGDLRIAGATLVLKGTITGNVYFAGEKLESSAIIAGNVKGKAQSVTFTGGSIGKDFNYESPQSAQNLNKVTISGKTTYTPAKKKEGIAVMGLYGFFVGKTLLMLLSSLFVGFMLLILIPRKIKEIDDRVRAEWLSNLLTGLVTLIVAPIIGFILLFLVVGWQAAVILFFTYTVLWMVASVLGLILVGHFLLRKIGLKQENYWLALIGGVILFYLLMLIPILNGLIGLAQLIGFTLPTFGALLNWWKDQLTSPAN